MKRAGAALGSSAVTVALAAALLGVPSAASADTKTVSRTPAWFGQVVVEDVELHEWETATIASVEHPKKTHPLPFHAYVSAELLDCSGAVAQRTYGISRNEKRKGKAWASTGQVALAFPEGSGPYEKFVVKVHAKGRETVAVDVTRSATFTLGCDGEFSRSASMPQLSRTGRPINADFSRSAAAALASKARFGRVVGKGKVGTTVRVKGAGAVVDGTLRPKSTRCWSSIRVLPPAGKKWESGLGGPCNASYLVAPKARFYTTRGTQVTRKRVGLVTEIDSGVMIGGHAYVKVFSLGRTR